MILTNAEKLQILSIALILRTVVFAPILPRKSVMQPERREWDSEHRTQILHTQALEKMGLAPIEVQSSK